MAGMDSLTQIVLGGALAAAIAPPQHRRAALLAGAALGTLPDLDTLVLLPLGLDPVDSMTWHRGPSHSLFVLIPLAALIWAAFKRLGGRVAESPVRWFWAIQLALVTHPLLDALTVYGTQLWWPHARCRRRCGPACSSSTWPTRCRCWWPACWPGAGASRAGAQRALAMGLALSTAYLGWSFVAKAQVDRAADQTLAAMGLPDAPRFSVPMPFNTLLWRVVVMTPDGYLAGQYSVVADSGPMRLRPQASDVAALDAVRGFPAAARLLLVQPRLHGGAGSGRPAGAVGPAHGRGARFHLPLRGGRARRRTAGRPCRPPRPTGPPTRFDGCPRFGTGYGRPSPTP